MNDEELERRLAALRPAALPCELEARLNAARPRSKLAWFIPVVTLAAAAVWAMFAIVERPPAAPVREPQPGDFRVFVPIAQESTLIAVEELGVIEPAPDQALRLVRATWLDDITYRGDDGHSTLRRQEPRAEIVSISLTSL